MAKRIGTSCGKGLRLGIPEFGTEAELIRAYVVAQARVLQQTEARAPPPSQLEPPVIEPPVIDPVAIDPTAL